MAIEPQKIYAVWLRETKRFLNSKSRIAGSLGMPLFFLVALGAGFGSVMPGYQLFIVPGIIGMTLLFNSIMTGVSVIWDREFGFLKEMLVAPTSRTNIVIGKALGGATTAILQGIIIMLLGFLFIGLPFLGIKNLILTFLTMLLISVTFVSLGIALASMIQEIETFQLVMNFVIMPIFFLSNALFPIQNMPSWLQTIANLNPMTYGVDALRNLLLGNSSFPLSIDITVLLIIPTILILAATYLFNRTSI